jgi:hypothetical protein
MIDCRCSICSCETGELIKNGGFEVRSSEPNFPFQYWEEVFFDFARVANEPALTNIAYEGLSAARFNSLTTVAEEDKSVTLQQTVTVTPGCIYKLSFAENLLTKGNGAAAAIPILTARVRVDMGPPILDPTAYNNHLTIDAGEQCFHITAVSMGNPHAVIPVENVEQVPLEIWGPLLEKHPHFPAGTNVEFVQILGETEIKVRVWERGAGITLACGTGACAAMVACHLLGKTSRYGQVELPGGDLWIEWDPVDNHVYMTGSAREVFRGVIGEM